MARRILIKCWCHRIPQRSFAVSSRADPTNKTNGRVSCGNLCVSLSGFIQSCASGSAALSDLFYLWLCSSRNARGLWAGRTYKWAVRFLLRGPVRPTIISHFFFLPRSPLTITPPFPCRQTTPPRVGVCRRQPSIILPLPKAPTKNTSQARSRGECGKKTAATPIGCRQCHLWINSVSVWLFFPPSVCRQTCQMLEERHLSPDSWSWR